MWVVCVRVGGTCLCEWVSIPVGGPHFVDGPRLCGWSTSLWVFHVFVGGPCLCGWSTSLWVIHVFVGGARLSGWPTSLWVVPVFIDGPHLCGWSTSLWVGHIFSTAEGPEWAPSGVKVSFAEFICFLEKVSGLDMNVGFKIGGRESAAWARRGAQSALVPGDLRGQGLPVCGCRAGRSARRPPGGGAGNSGGGGRGI